MIEMFRTEERKNLAKAFELMMSMEAWKVLEDYSARECESSMQRMDSKSASILSLGEVCEERGFRKGIRKILKYAKDCKEGI